MDFSLLIENIKFHYNYVWLVGMNALYFFTLYFGLAPLFLSCCHWLTKRNILSCILNKTADEKQIRYEKSHSFVSIIIFSFSIVPIIYLGRLQVIKYLPDTTLNVIVGVIGLTLWNEVHFFAVHKLLHTKFLMRKVHFVHHCSKVPTVYAVYCFHWLEAILLSTVPLCIAPFISFPFLSIAIYPLVSILFNYAGHCNYRFGNGEGNSWVLFSTHHHQHHSNGKRNFGFILNHFDKLFITKQKKLS